ncbi:MAG: hypothetical protein IJ191_02560, partial [Treponema sp.]|nr:hypothetical protein [Treponema sp.]
QTTTGDAVEFKASGLLYIKIRNQTTTARRVNPGVCGYYTSKLEIKPQQPRPWAVQDEGYYTSKLEIKPQPRAMILL